MRLRLKAVAGSLAMILTISPAAHAGEIPRVGPADATVRTAAYSEWQVYELRGAYRSAMVVEFAVGEKIENVGVGDSSAWEASRYENVLFLKPRQKAPPTNAIVQTLTKDGKLRLYNFSLSASDNPGAEMVKVKFIYPSEIAHERRAADARRQERESAERTAAQADTAIFTGTRNWAYSVSGAAAFVPNEVWDNGRATAFRFAGQTELPAIYAVDSDGNERLVPSHVQESIVVVQQIAAQWRLRAPGKVLCIYNEDYRPAWGPERGSGTGTSTWFRRILGSE